MSRDHRAASRLRPRGPLTAGTLALVGVLAAGCASGSGGSSAAAPGDHHGPTAGPHGQSSSSASPRPSSTHLGTPTPIPTNPRLQSCEGRLGKAIAGPPKDLPRPPGTKFSTYSVQFGVWSGYLPGTDPVAPIEALHQNFISNGYHVGKVTTKGTSSRFSFSGGKYSGQVYVAVLCTGELRVLYQFGHGSKFAPRPRYTPTGTPRPTHTRHAHSVGRS